MHVSCHRMHTACNGTITSNYLTSTSSHGTLTSRHGAHSPSHGTHSPRHGAHSPSHGAHRQWQLPMERMVKENCQSQCELHLEASIAAQTFPKPQAPSRNFVWSSVTPGMPGTANTAHAAMSGDVFDQRVSLFVFALYLDRIHLRMMHQWYILGDPARL